jgi:hypothetical protein
MQNGSEWERDGECYSREAALLGARRERLTLTHKSKLRGPESLLAKIRRGGITRNTFPTGLLLRDLLGNLGFDVCFSETRAEKGRACYAPALESPLLYDRYHKKKQAYAQRCKPNKQR